MRTDAVRFPLSLSRVGLLSRLVDEEYQLHAYMQRGSGLLKQMNCDLCIR